jgi:hypothetical protein
MGVYSELDAQARGYMDEEFTATLARELGKKPKRAKDHVSLLEFPVTRKQLRLQRKQYRRFLGWSLVTVTAILIIVIVGLTL